MSSLVTIRLPSGTSPGSDLTREPVARITSVAFRTRSPPAPGVPSSPGWLTRILPGPSSLPATVDPGHLVLGDQALEPGPHPLHDRVAAGGHRRVVDGRARRAASGRSPWRGGCDRRRPPIRAGPWSGCSRGAGRCRRSCPRRRGRPSARAGRPGRRPCSRRCRRRARRDRSHWTSRRPWFRVPQWATRRAGRAGGSSPAMVRAGSRDAQPSARSAPRRSRRAGLMLDSGLGRPQGRRPRPPVERAVGPCARPAHRRPDARRLSRRVDPGRRAGGPGQRRHRSAHGRIGADRRDERAAGARAASGPRSWSPATCSRGSCRSCWPAS